MNKNWKFDDPIDEIYEIRRKISSQYGNDVRLIAVGVAERTGQLRDAGRIVISSPAEMARLYAEA